MSQYSQLIESILKQYIDLSNRCSTAGPETFLVVDADKANFISINVGWQKLDGHTRSSHDMETIAQYRQIIRDVLESHVSHDDPDIECQIICDTENDHYQLVELGWQGLQRLYACYIHLDIKNGKIWIQYNMTEADLGQELVDRGVPPSDIILGLHPPYKRPYTNYGVA